jgi:hypothetical protein
MSTWVKLKGTQTGQFILGLLGVQLKNNGGNLSVRNNADNADASVIASEFLASGDIGLKINSDAAESGADWAISIARPTTGMTADWTLTLPTTPGSANQVLQTNGTGITTWVNASSGATDITLSVPFAFGSAATIPIGTLPTNAAVLTTTVIVDTAFDSTPSLSVGITANNSKYFGSGDCSLALGDRFDVDNQLPADGSSETLEIYYSAASATVGAGRVLISYAVPA